MIDLRSLRPAGAFCLVASLLFVTLSKPGKPNVVPAPARTSPSNENQVGENQWTIDISAVPASAFRH